MFMPSPIVEQSMYVTHLVHTYIHIHTVDTFDIEEVHACLQVRGRHASAFDLLEHVGKLLAHYVPCKQHFLSQYVCMNVCMQLYFVVCICTCVRACVCVCVCVHAVLRFYCTYVYMYV